MSPIIRRARAGAVPRLAVAGLALIALAGFGPCDRHDPTGPAPAPQPQELTLSSCWPNADGLAWDYAATAQDLAVSGGSLYPDSLSVPRVTLDDAVALIALPPDTLAGSRTEYVFRMQFAGDTTTQSGARAQNLRESFPGSAAPASSWSADFLRRVARARPSLRARLARCVALDGAAAAGHPYPNFIHGYAWSRTRDWIGTYGDVDLLPAWRFLESNFLIGHEFTFQLLPSLTHDVFLESRVTRRLAVDLPGGARSTSAIEVVYLLDYGVEAWMDSGANVIGYGRFFDYGRVIYAAGVGPVFDEERRMALVGDPAHARGLWTMRLTLTAASTLPGTVALR